MAKRTMPRQKPGASDSTVLTPWDFIEAVYRKLDISSFKMDLAATDFNKRAKRYISPEIDSLAQDWRKIGREIGGGWFWLNPPYDRIAPWMKKTAETWPHFPLEAANPTAVLIPASVGSNWWRDYVHEKCQVLFLNGRIQFLDRHGHAICSAKTGKPTPYPKDLALLLYGAGTVGYDIWSWKDK